MATGNIVLVRPPANSIHTELLASAEVPSYEGGAASRHHAPSRLFVHQGHVQKPQHELVYANRGNTHQGKDSARDQRGNVRANSV
jgi:hypothetical protein